MLNLIGNGGVDFLYCLHVIAIVLNFGNVVNVPEWFACFVILAMFLNFEHRKIA